MGQLDLINKHFPDGDDEDGRGKKRMSRATWILAGAVVVFGALLYVGYSGHKNDNGNLPVVTADDAEIKSKPSDPGGMEVPHQDATIYNELNSQKQKTAEVEHLLPESEKPMAVPTSAAKSADALAKAEAPNTAMATEAVDQAANLPPVAQAPAEPTHVATTNSSTSALAANNAASVPAVTPVPETAAQNAAPVATPVPPASSAPKTAAVTTAPASKMPAGSTRIQLASFPNEATAKSEWSRISKKNADVLGGLSANFVKADIPGKGTYFRIQAGPLQMAKAESVCSSLKTRAQPCMIVK